MEKQEPTEDGKELRSSEHGDQKKEKEKVKITLILMMIFL